MCVCMKGGRKGKEERMLVQENVFIYVAIYLNKVKPLNCLFECFLIIWIFLLTWSLKITVLDFSHAVVFFRSSVDKIMKTIFQILIFTLIHIIFFIVHSTFSTALYICISLQILNIHVLNKTFEPLNVMIHMVKQCEFSTSLIV